MTAASSPAKFAVSLARPVARGWLSRDAAIASILLANDRAMQAGRAQGNGTLAERVQIGVWLMDQAVKRQDDERAKACAQIVRTVRPLIESRAPAGRLLAEAHDINGDTGFLLTEAEVKEEVAQVLSWTLKRPRNVRG